MTSVMLRSLLLPLVMVAKVAFGQPGELAYRLVEEWPKQARSVAGTPAAWNFIQVSGMAVRANADGVIVLHRGAHPVLEFDSDGNFVRSWGDGLFSFGKVVAIAPVDRRPGGSGYSAVYGPAGCDSCGAHAVRIDAQGNVLLVDACAHAIYKTDGQANVVMTLGSKGVSGTGRKQFNLPTDVAFARQGNIYVSDGYGSARVVKFSARGEYLLEFGKRGTGPGQFGLPHNLAVDAQERVYVTDRDNSRIEVFDSDGKFLRQWPTATGVSGLFLTKEGRLWAGDTLYELDGKIVGRLPQADPGAHGIAVGASGEVYLGLLSGKVQKFVPVRR
jgi:DNA-binding beta-propeller fold protein YncE